jgi:hypothetical protein
MTDGERQQQLERMQRRMRGWSVSRGQCNCRACGRYLPLQWVGDLCASCQDSGKVPRPPERRRRAPRGQP